MAALLNKIKPIFLLHAKKHWKYLSVECAPPVNPGTWAKALGQLGALAAKNPANVTVGQALVNSMVFAEIMCWFFIGEVIGKHWAAKSIPFPVFFFTGLSQIGITGNGTWCGYNTAKYASDGRKIYANSNGEYVE